MAESVAHGPVNEVTLPRIDLPVLERKAAVTEAASTGIPAARGWHVRTALAALVGVCLLPSFLICGYVIYEDYRTQRAMLRSESMAYTKAIVAALDRDLSSIQANLQILATAPALTADDPTGLEEFYHRAKQVLPLHNINNYVLIAPAGHQVMNTLRAWGEPLPAVGGPPQLRAIFDLNKPMLTDVFIGPVTGKPILAMGVPVHRGEEILYSLNSGIFPERILNVMRQVQLPEKWIAVIIDSTGTIVARTHEMERFVGHKAGPALVQQALTRREGVVETVTLEGIPVTTTFSRSSMSNWTVAIGIPRELLEGALRRSFAVLLAAAMLMFSFGVAMAYLVGGGIVKAMGRLIPMAEQVGLGRSFRPEPMGLYEADAVARALKVASDELNRAQYEAHHDALTGLANRALLGLMLEKQALLSQRNGTRVCLLCIDLDGFKVINDTHGHAVGDALLREVGQRLGAAVRACDVPARPGGDEFVVMLVDTTIDGARTLAESIIASLRRPFLIVGRSLSISASIGIAGYPETTLDCTHILADADRALYAAKHAGKDRVVVATPR